MSKRLQHLVLLAYKLLAGWLLVIGVASCSPATPDPKPPLNIPIALTKAGSSAEFEFWAYPKDSHEKNVLMVELRIRRNWENLESDANRALYRKLRSAKITLHLVATKNDMPASFLAYSEFEPTEQIRPIERVGSSEVRARAYSHDGEYEYFYLAGLSRDEGGRYKVKVEVVQPDINLEGMQAEVFVAYRLFGGK